MHGGANCQKKNSPVYCKPTRMALESLVKAIEDGKTNEVLNLVGSVDLEQKHDDATPLQHAVLSENTDCVAILLAKGAKIHPKDCETSDVRSPLHFACGLNDLDTTRLLLRHGADVHTTQKFGSIPLWETAMGDKHECVTALLLYGTNPRHQDSISHSILHSMVLWNSVNSLKILVLWNADPLATLPTHGLVSPSFTTPLQRAKEARGRDCYKALKEFTTQCKKRQQLPQKIAKLRSSIRKDDIAAVRRIMEHDADVMENHTSWPLLHIACMSKAHQSAQFLVEHGSNVNEDYAGLTPLHMACESNCMRCTDILIRNGANLNAMIPDVRTTPLHIASEKNNVQAMLLLLERGADVSVRDRSGFTPLHTACMWDSSLCARLLVKFEANLKAKIPKLNCTPLGIARKMNAEKCIRFLVQHKKKSKKSSEE